MKLEDSMKQLILEISEDGLGVVEAFIDSDLTNEFTKGLPAVNIAFTVIKSPFVLKKYYFAKKVQKFLENFAETSQEEREKFIKKIEKKPKLLTNIGSTTIHYIEHCDDENKSAIIGYIYKLMIQEAISHEDGFRICNTVINMMLQDIIIFCSVSDFNISRNEILASIGAAQGLCIQVYNPESSISNTEHLRGGGVKDSDGKINIPDRDRVRPVEYKLSKFGRFFQDYLKEALENLDQAHAT